VGGVQWDGGWVGGSTNVNTGTWQFVSIVRSGGADTFYVNGVADATTATDMNLSEQGTQDIRLGFNAGDTADGAYMFVGRISGAYVYGTALNAGQIKSLMNAGPAGMYGSLPATTNLSITTAGAALDVDGARQAVASLSGVPGSRVYLGGGELTVGNSGSTTFAGDISDSGGAGSGTGGSLVMDGAGEFVLSGTNTYDGGTTVSNGTLVLGSNEAILRGSNLTVGNPSEFLAVAAARNATASAGASAPVPEPGTLALLMAFWSAVACHRFSKRQASGSRI
jgi:autotransporter-associated beta strand protein